MVLVNEKLIYEKIKENNLLKRAFNYLEQNLEIKTLLKQSNINTVERMFYNDHGIVHSRIVSGASLEILDILLNNNINPSVVLNKIGDENDAKIIVLVSAYLHDIGNSIHRKYHHIFGAFISFNLIDKLLSEIYENEEKRIFIRQEILNSIYSHDETINSITIESGIIKVADGLDMAEGRARIPYKLGKADIHSFSALAIRSVEIESSKDIPIIIKVNMENESGIFQIEEVLNRKINSSSIKKYIKIVALKNNELLKYYTFE